MSSRKKSMSTSGSSCSTSGSSSSSGSSSDSDSNSSSSDSESSSSQGGNRSSASNSTPNESKSSQPTPVKKENAKESSNVKTENEKPSANTSANKTKTTNATSKGAQSQQQQHKTNSRKVSVYSSEDEAKRMQNEIKKKTVASQALKSKSAPIAPPTGGKAPPAVVKQHQQSKAAANRNNNKSNAKTSANSKKKSIFSPDNSSESEEETTTKKPVQPKKPPAQRGRPPKQKPPEKVEKPEKTEKPIAKSSESSSASSTDTSTSRDSESESSAQCDMKPVTRSSNTRKSKHLTTIFNPKASDPSESETDGKQSKSPVKRTKGKANNSKINYKLNTSVPKKSLPVVEERKCPVDGCDSMGHLGGASDKHFTQEACPVYHNVSLEETKKRREERLKNEDERKKATILFDPMSGVTSVEQKTFQMKIAEIRANFVPNPPSPIRQQNQSALAKNHQQNGDARQKEPILKGDVSEYDMKLFQEAQAVASEKIEADLLKWPAERGTKIITMGRHNMEVWYQSPYPDDAARLPKLYLCEFCLRYQKSEITMKRHAAKCVWRHPPGDEIYRKGKLGVWQVDDKRQKQYCQHLCLLAKFFLDHKTLYYDVEPFLFYVMTVADSEGCHTIGYFSKEKNSFLNYNVSCILTLPPYQRKGYGRLLIDFIPNPPSPIRQQNQSALAKNHQQNGDARQKEPILKGDVSEYDMKLFQEAQAVASEKIEADLLKWPAERGTKIITMGRHNMEVWYQSPYPDDAARLPKLYLCEFCLRYQKSEITMKRHAAKCVWRHPPGDEIYRKGKLGVWQVDDKRQKQYCQHLCLLAKFFLDHKTLYYDVEPFLFYVMTVADSEGCHTIGYFSKEKNSFLNYNVSCILTLPPYQRKGYGRLLIDFSYLLTRVQGKIGSPEKPLSDLGLISYRSYWKDVLLDYLCSRTGSTLSIKDVSQEMAINSYDIVSTLQALGMMKYWKGKHIILKKQDVLEEYAERVKRRGAVVKIDPAHLRWTPFVPPPATSS